MKVRTHHGSGYGWMSLRDPYGLGTGIGMARLENFIWRLTWKCPDCRRLDVFHGRTLAKGFRSVKRYCKGCHYITWHRKRKPRR